MGELSLVLILAQSLRMFQVIACDPWQPVRPNHVFVRTDKFHCRLITSSLQFLLCFVFVSLFRLNWNRRGGGQAALLILGRS